MMNLLKSDVLSECYGKENSHVQSCCRVGHDCRVFCNRNIFYGIYLFPVPFLAVEVVEYPEIYFRKIFFRILREYA